MARLIRRHGDLQCTAVRHAHILAREPNEPPRHIQRVFARLQHTRKPVDRRVRVAVAHRFVQRRDDVVVLLAGFVVQKRLAADALLQRLHRHGRLVALAVPVQNDHLQRSQRRSRVTVCKRCKHFQHLIGDFHRLVTEAAWVFDCALHQLHKLILGKCLQNEHLAARQKCGVHLKRGVLCRRADEHDAALFHKRQKRVLLRLIKAVDFVDKQQRALTHAMVLLRLAHHAANFLDAARHGAEIDEIRLRPRRNDLRQRRFTHARRPPKDHGRHAVFFNQLPQHFALAEQMALPRKFLQRTRPHPRRKRHVLPRPVSK